MPVQLTSAFDPGDMDSGTYAQMKIEVVEIQLERKMIKLYCHWGNTVSDVWERGIKEGIYDISGTDYDDIVANSSPVGEETTYEAVKRGLYQYLIDEALVAGTIV